MLTAKLLRIEDSLIEKIEALAAKLSETEYTSFSAMARKLIRVGLEYMSLDRKNKRVVGIPRCHYSKLDGYGNIKTYNDTEIQSIMAALDCFHENEGHGTESNSKHSNHLTISWRTRDAEGEHFGIGVLGNLDDLKPGDEILIGLPSLHKLVVMGKPIRNE